MRIWSHRAILACSLLRHRSGSSVCQPSRTVMRAARASTTSHCRPCSMRRRRPLGAPASAGRRPDAPTGPRRGAHGAQDAPVASDAASPPHSGRCPGSHLEVFPAGEDGTIFTTHTGTPYRHEYYGTRVFAIAVQGAGLPARTTSHDLRHHYASVLLAAGENVVTVAERLGHETRRWCYPPTATSCLAGRSAPGERSMRPGTNPPVTATVHLAAPKRSDLHRYAAVTR